MCISAAQAELDSQLQIQNLFKIKSEAIYEYNEACRNKNFKFFNLCYSSSQEHMQNTKFF